MLRNSSHFVSGRRTPRFFSISIRNKRNFKPKRTRLRYSRFRTILVSNRFWVNSPKKRCWSFCVRNILRTACTTSSTSCWYRSEKTYHNSAKPRKSPYFKTSTLSKPFNSTQYHKSFNNSYKTLSVNSWINWTSRSR